MQILLYIQPQPLCSCIPHYGLTVLALSDLPGSLPSSQLSLVSVLQVGDIRTFLTFLSFSAQTLFVPTQHGASVQLVMSRNVSLFNKLICYGHRHTRHLAESLHNDLNMKLYIVSNISIVSDDNKSFSEHNSC